MQEFFEISRAISSVIGVLSLILNCILAYAVNQDAQRLCRMPSHLFLVGPIIWSLLTLVSGVVGLAIYWLVHYSSLASSSQQDAPPR